MIDNQITQELKVSETQGLRLQIVLGDWLRNNRYKKEDCKHIRNILRQIELFKGELK